MRIDAYYTIPEAERGQLAGSTAVVIDVVRATTTIIEALANGAREIYPTVSTEDAVQLASSLGREDTLLCGERRGVKVEGFHLGNSPLEFTADAVSGKKLVMSTSNGTRALAAGQEADRILPCALTNLSAVAQTLEDVDHVTIVCAGRQDQFAFEDALCAGLLIQALAANGDVTLNDAAAAAKALAGARKPTKRFMHSTSWGETLLGLGLGADLAVCADRDRHDVVGIMRDRAISRLDS